MNITSKQSHAPRRWTMGLFAVALVAALLAPAARTEKTRYWRQTSYEDFDKGTAKGVALRSDGRLLLAPRMAQFADPNLAYLWALRVDSRGILYAAGGSNAKVLRVDSKGASAVVFESPELAAQALALDAQDNLYIGTSPDGKVYKLTPNGEKSVFFEPKTKYIWDIEIDAAGTVYVATGDKGEVFAVAPDGKGELYYRSPETHIRALALDRNGNLLIGTDPNGLIVRLDKGAPGTKAENRGGFVLYEMNRKEVTALLAGPAGEVYAAGIGEKPRTTPLPAMPQPIVPQTAIATVSGAVTGAPVTPVQQQTTFLPFPALAGGSEVYRIGVDGAPEELWTSREDLVYTLGFAPSGKLLLGTGNRGLVLQLEGGRMHATFPKTASGQVTGLIGAGAGKMYVATANPGKIFTLGPGYEPEGTFESQTFDAKIFSEWGRLTWWGEDGATSGAVEFYARSGNTSNPEKNWSVWAGPYKDATAAAVNCPPARFVQWKAVFRPPAGNEAGAGAVSISWVNLAYLPKNVAPTVDAIVVQNPGVRVQSFSSQPQQQQNVQLRMPPVPGQFGGSGQPPQPPRFDPPPQGIVQRGSMSVVWGARDANDDEMVYAVYYRGEKEKAWKLLKDKVEQKFLSWDVSSFPDGAYFLKIVASDAPSNPAGEALTAERESDRFEVDSTPPQIEDLRAEPAAIGGEARVRFTVRDSFSAIARAEYSLDGADWQLVLPGGRLSDAPLEQYEIVLRGIPAGEHTVAVRAFDSFENQAGAKVTFTSLPRGTTAAARPR